MNLKDGIIILNAQGPFVNLPASLTILTTEQEDFDSTLLSYKDTAVVFDLSLGNRDQKCSLLEKIGHQLPKAKIISDLTTHWGDAYLKQYSNLVGGLALEFWSPTSKREVFLKDQEFKSLVDELFTFMNLTPHYTLECGIAFTYPRVISMLINEAYIALEENLGAQNDLDTAMKYGVNYPLGLHEWSERLPKASIVQVLETLFEITQDARYKCSQRLKLEALKTHL